MLAASLAVCLAADAAGPVWAGVARISVSVKPAATAPSVGVQPYRGISISPSLLNPLGSRPLGLGSSLAQVENLRVYPTIGAAAVKTTAGISVRATALAGRGTIEAAKTRQTLNQRLGGLLTAARSDGENIAKSSGGGLYQTARFGFARLLNRGLIRTAGASDVAVPKGKPLGRFRANGLQHTYEAGEKQDFAPPEPFQENPKTVRTYLLGTGVFKIGMEALSLSAPLIALTIFGQVKFAAILVVGWWLSQIIFSSLSGGILDRRSPSKVLAVTMGLQALSVAAIIGLFAVDQFLPGMLAFKLVSPISLLALYSLAGGFMGIADTARQVIPPDIIGPQERRLKIFNAKTHIAYELAGVTGALLTGVIISQFGVIPALLLHPPAYLLAAFIFWRMKLRPQRLTAAKMNGDVVDTARNASLAGQRGNPLTRAISDIKEGAKTVLSKPIFRWSTFALVLPLVTHRLLEGLLIPVTAKTILGNAAVAAWIIGASNLGELLGALLLIRALMSSDPGAEKKRFRSSFWVRLMTIGSLGIVSLTFASSLNLWIILGMIAFRSMTWATSELSLRSKLQNSLPKHLRGRAFAFISAVAFALILATSMGVGFLMDIVPQLTVFYGVDIALAVAAVVLFFAAYRLNDAEKPQP